MCILIKVNIKILSGAARLTDLPVSAKPKTNSKIKIHHNTCHIDTLTCGDHIIHILATELRDDLLRDIKFVNMTKTMTNRW